MLVMYEMAYSVLEYKSNKLIISLNPSDMLLTENWHPVRHLNASATGNIEKNYIARHPQFDEVKFPFLVCSGLQFYGLINVKDYRMEMFVDASAAAPRGIKAFFFQKEKYGFSFHFTICSLTDENIEHHKWY